MEMETLKTVAGVTGVVFYLQLPTYIADKRSNSGICFIEEYLSQKTIVFHIDLPIKSSYLRANVLVM